MIIDFLRERESLVDLGSNHDHDIPIRWKENFPGFHGNHCQAVQVLSFGNRFPNIFLYQVVNNARTGNCFPSTWGAMCDSNWSGSATNILFPNIFLYQVVKHAWTGNCFPSTRRASYDSNLSGSPTKRNDYHKTRGTIPMQSCRRWEGNQFFYKKYHHDWGLVVFVECKRVNDAQSFPSINWSVQYSTKEDQLNCKFGELLLLCDVVST